MASPTSLQILRLTSSLSPVTTLTATPCRRERGEGGAGRLLRRVEEGHVARRGPGRARRPCRRAVPRASTSLLAIASTRKPSALRRSYSSFEVLAEERGPSGSSSPSSSKLAQRGKIASGAPLRDEPVLALRRADHDRHDPPLEVERDLVDLRVLRDPEAARGSPCARGSPGRARCLQPGLEVAVEVGQRQHAVVLVRAPRRSAAPGSRGPCVSVPVLSVQSTSIAPRFWIALRRLTMTFFLDIAIAPFDRQTVTIIGSISGVSPTATATAKKKASPQSPFVSPLIRNTSGTITSMKRSISQVKSRDRLGRTPSAAALGERRGHAAEVGVVTRSRPRPRSPSRSRRWCRGRRCSRARSAACRRVLLDLELLDREATRPSASPG